MLLEKNPSPAFIPSPFLEEGLKPLQVKSLQPKFLSQTILTESHTVGRLIAQQADPVHWPKDKIQDISLYIVLKSRQYKISPLFVLSVIQVESGFHPAIVSPKGAVGLMQLMPATAQELAADLGIPYQGVGTLEDPKVNIELGLRYILFLKSRFPSPAHMLMAYNMGPAAVRKRLNAGEELPLGYYQKVMEAMNMYKREARSPHGHGVWL